MKNGSTSLVEGTFREEVFSTLWGLQGRNAFPSALRSEYIKLLWEHNPQSTKVLKKGELLALPDACDVLKMVKPFDPQLSIFASLVERFDSLSPKALSILKTPSLAPSDIKKIQSMAATSYMVSATADEWSIQEVIQVSGKRTRIVVSKRSSRVMKARLLERDLPAVTWKALEDEVREHFNSAVNNLHDVHVSVSAPYKFQVAIDFDWEAETTELSSDLAEWDDETGKPKDRRTLKTAALLFMAEKMGLSATQTTFASIVVDGKAKDPDLRKKLERQNNDDYLIVVRGGTYFLPGNAQENPEDVKAHLRMFDVAHVKSAAEKYYSENGSFRGFFQTNKNFDRNFTKVQGKVLGGESPMDSSGVFLKVFLSDKPITEKEKGSKLSGKEIEAVSFEYQNESGEWIIRTPEYSGRVRDAFISELHNLSRKPTRPPKPKVGSPS